MSGQIAIGSDLMPLCFYKILINTNKFLTNQANATAVNEDDNSQNNHEKRRKCTFFF